MVISVPKFDTPWFNQSRHLYDSDCSHILKMMWICWIIGQPTRGRPESSCPKNASPIKCRLLIITDVKWIELARSGVRWWKFIAILDLRISWRHGINVKYGILTAVHLGGYDLLGVGGKWMQKFTTQRHMPWNYTDRTRVVISAWASVVCRRPLECSA